MRLIDPLDLLAMCSKQWAIMQMWTRLSSLLKDLKIVWENTKQDSKCLSKNLRRQVRMTLLKSTLKLYLKFQVSTNRFFLNTNQFLAFKKELDSSVHMANFLYHRFQAALSQNSNDSPNDSPNSSCINEIN